MKKRVKNQHGPRHVTPAGRSVFRDLFPEAEAEELEIRAELLRGLTRWLSDAGLTQVEADAHISMRTCQNRSVQEALMGSHGCSIAAICRPTRPRDADLCFPSAIRVSHLS